MFGILEVTGSEPESKLLTIVFALIMAYLTYITTKDQKWIAKRRALKAAKGNGPPLEMEDGIAAENDVDFRIADASTRHGENFTTSTDGEIRTTISADSIAQAADSISDIISKLNKELDRKYAKSNRADAPQRDKENTFRDGFSSGATTRVSGDESFT